MASLNARFIAGAVAALCLALLVTASKLDPDTHGHGTHEQLGLTPCAWPVLFDLPCPACGMTTACAHAADLEFASAFATQPMGAMVAIAAAVTFWIALHTAFTGSRSLTAFASVFAGKGAIVLIGGLIAAWVYKIVTWT